MPKTAKEYLDTKLPEFPQPENDSGSLIVYSILDFREIEPGDVTIRMRDQIIALAIPRLRMAYPWATSILPDQMGINSGGWLMHFKVIR